MSVGYGDHLHGTPCAPSKSFSLIEIFRLKCAECNECPPRKKRYLLPRPEEQSLAFCQINGILNLYTFNTHACNPCDHASNTS